MPEALPQTPNEHFEGLLRELGILEGAMAKKILKMHKESPMGTFYLNEYIDWLWQQYLKSKGLSK